MTRKFGFSDLSVIVIISCVIAAGFMYAAKLDKASGAARSKQLKVYVYDFPARLAKSIRINTPCVFQSGVYTVSSYEFPVPQDRSKVIFSITYSGGPYMMEKLSLGAKFIFKLCGDTAGLSGNIIYEK